MAQHLAVEPQGLVDQVVVAMEEIQQIHQLPHHQLTKVRVAVAVVLLQTQTVVQEVQA